MGQFSCSRCSMRPDTTLLDVRQANSLFLYSFGLLALEVMIKEGSKERTQVALLGLQVERVRSVGAYLE